MAMSVGDSRLIISPSQAATAQAPTRVFRVSQVRRLRKCQQVAAVCYRIRGSGIEFLLVQTRGGRWTFPKGGVEPGLTHALLITEPNWLASWSGLWHVSNDYAWEVAQRPMSCRKCSA